MVDNVDDFRPLGELAGEFNITQFKPPGPKSLELINSTKLLRVIAGPYGSAKTTTCEVGEVFTAMRSPICIDGVRRYRLLTLRDNYRQLYRTAIATWHQWFPPSAGEWTGGQDRPAEHKLRFIDEYGPVEFEHIFAAIPDQDIRDFLDGYEISSMFLNAATSIPQDVWNFGIGRIGRYPPQRLLPKGMAIDKHIVADINKADVDHYLYDMLVLNLNRETTHFVDMPGGMDPGAENVENLTPGYYAAMIAANPDWWVNIYVHNRWGPSRHGQPVYEGFRQNRHVANGDFDALPELDLIIGLDAGTETGGRPSAVFGQVTPFGRVRIIDELYLGRCGPSRFFEALLGKLDQSHLRGAAHRIRAFCDPAAFSYGDKESGELTWVQIGEETLGVQIDPTESNELEGFRLEAIRILLREADGDEQGIILSPRCGILIKGFNSGYCYEIKEIAGKRVENPKPKKSDESHPHDALQYLVNGFFGKSFVANSTRRRIDPEAGRLIGGSSPGFSADFDLFS